MKSLSAALVIVAGLLTLLTSVLFIKHDDTQIFVCFVGGAVALAGLAGWFWAMKQPS
jgi:hypothetical protein